MYYLPCTFPEIDTVISLPCNCGLKFRSFTVEFEKY